MAKKQDTEGIIRKIANGTLSLFGRIAQSAAVQLGERRRAEPDVFASVNTFNEHRAVQSLANVHADAQADFELLAREPAIARVVVEDEEGSEIVFFISRAGPPPLSIEGIKLASYRSPLGRIAALPIGSDFQHRMSGRIIELRIVEKAQLRPSLQGGEWDSLDSRLEGVGYGPNTVRSFRILLGLDRAVEDDFAELDAQLAEEKSAQNVIEGIQRTVLRKMELRDQAVLDPTQDLIFRLPLNSRLLVLGPPGSGKTTTLIRRLGQKLDVSSLDDDEQMLVETSARATRQSHAQSWAMFAPTELLKLYVKEAFALEEIPASDERIRTWTDYRRELARNRLPILRTSTGSGIFVLRDASGSLSDYAIEHQIDWFEDFHQWQILDFWNELKASAEILSKEAADPAHALGRRLLEIVEEATPASSTAALVGLAAEAERAQQLTTSIRAETDGRIRRTLNVQVNGDKQFLDKLSSYMETLSEGWDDGEDQSGEEDDDERLPRVGRAAAQLAFMRTSRAQARAHANGRTLGRSSNVGRIAEWLGERSLPVSDRETLGKALLTQAAAQRFSRAIGRYLSGTAARYRRFRRLRQGEGKWYAKELLPTDIEALEVDIILLSVLRGARELLAERSILRTANEQSLTLLRSIQGIYLNQVVVDEATDFSPIQLGCMASITALETQSFFACGDFNQRITDWGTRSLSELQRVVRGIETRTVNVTYRHSKQLNDLARDLVALNGAASSSVLPEAIQNDGVSPILATQLSTPAITADWLAKRIIEVERFAEILPTIAILVNTEELVSSVADALGLALQAQNIRVVPCLNGQFVGQENDVRVFDVQHIKGLEFEAVFFVGIDELAKAKPKLFDKYLYVGATRAATYLGITCVGSELPKRISPLHKHFVAAWPRHVTNIS